MEPCKCFGEALVLAAPRDLFCPEPVKSYLLYELQQFTVKRYAMYSFSFLLFNNK